MISRNLSHKLEASAPLHAIIWAFGRQFFAPPARPKLVVSNVQDEGSLAHHMERLTTHQLSTALRMQGLDSDEDNMLTSLESMATAGEINFVDFIGRIQNLFPHTLDALDVTLRMKIAVMLLPSDA